MSETGRILRITQDIANQNGLITQAWLNYALPDGRLHLAAAIYRAATGETPDVFYDNVAASERLIHANQPVMTALRWISAVLDTWPPHDGDTRRDDHLEHITTWLDQPDFLTGARPNTSDVIGVLIRTAETADTLTDIPRPRAAA
ncbi:hypothetical protein [Streptomyces sp. NPDC046371]|uniref:hypothetical protein n=1 Tax=Streptomyces sp. NPDC046371 TaxID=3154916 RepID=UPI0033ECC866